MFSTDDTIVAIATPPGRGGIGVVRLSGPDAARYRAALIDRRALQPLDAAHATLGAARSRTPAPLDQVIATYFQAPHSYTGEDVVEISAHGSPVVLRAIVRGGVAAGARLAEPGEFTLRAYLHGRIDLVQAEAVADLIDAVTPLQARAAFDQLNGTLTERIAAIDARLFDLIARARGVAWTFPTRATTSSQPDAAARELDAIDRRHQSRCLPAPPAAG